MTLTRREKLYYHLLDPERLPLDDREQTHLERCKSAFHIMHTELSKNRIIRKLMEVDATLNNFTAAKIIADTEDIFSPMLKRNKDFDRAVLIERFLVLEQKMEEKEEWEIQRLCLSDLVKLTGAGIHEKKGGVNPEDINLPDIIITSDTKRLIEDINHEEV